MNNFNVDECMRAFVLFCENVEKNGLVGQEECQYWVFEQGYLAALSVDNAATSLQLKIAA
jgi:hypothetical protein